MFKKGDKLRVIDEDRPRLKLGDIVEILQDQNFRATILIDNNGNQEWWFPSRFELVNIRPSMEKQVELAQSLIGKTVKSPGGKVFKVVNVGVRVPKDDSNMTTITIDNVVNQYGFCVYVCGTDAKFDVMSVTIIPDYVSVELSKGYKAIVKKDTIQVGCQIFPISILEELNKAHKSL